MVQGDSQSGRAQKVPMGWALPTLSAKAHGAYRAAVGGPLNVVGPLGRQGLHTCGAGAALVKASFESGPGRSDSP